MVKRSKELKVYTLPLVIGVIAQFISGISPSSTNASFDINYTHDSYFYKFPSEDQSPELIVKFSPFLEKDLYGFKEALAFKESTGSYSVVNDFGYLGKYQFGKGTLALVGVYNADLFLRNPVLQERAFVANLSRNKWILRKDIKRFTGKYVAGVLITESGMLAAAHLSGPGAVKSFLRNNGQNNLKDAYGTSITAYMEKFKSYDLSALLPNRKAKAKAASSYYSFL